MAPRLRRAWWAGAIAACLCLVITAGCSDDDGKVTEPPPDLIPPGAVILTVVSQTDTSVTLAWRAPGDDDTVGVASRYDLRRSLEPITADSWGEAEVVDSISTPRAPGAPESCTVEGLLRQAQHYFSLRTTDDAGNVSALSNVIHIQTGPRSLCLTPRSGFLVNGPAYSPDGEWIAYAGWDLQTGVRGLWKIRATGGESVNLSTLTAEMPAWTPDGRRIVFTHLFLQGQSYNADLWITDADGTNARLLLSTPERERSPLSTPDGMSIIFHSAGRILRMPIDGGETELVTPVRCDHMARFTLSPSGDRLAFTTAGDSLCILDLWDGSISVIEGFPKLQGNHLDWSPDGTRILFLRQHPPDGALPWTIELDGTVEGPLVANYYLLLDPVWSPDGRKLAGVGSMQSTQTSFICILLL